MTNCLGSLAMSAVVLLACSSPAPPPTCADLKKHTNVLYMEAKHPQLRGKEGIGIGEGWQTDLVHQTNAACSAGLTEEQLRCAGDARQLADLVSCDLPGIRVTKDDMHTSCAVAGYHWATYMFKPWSDDWKAQAKDVRGWCEREKWPTELRDCWGKIHDVASHETCVAMRKELRP